jgi:DTW domain-containing protein
MACAPAPSPSRKMCRRCRRPSAACYCALLPSLQTRTRLVFLQHLRERKVAIGTARLAHLALPNSEFHVGLSFAQDPKVACLADQPGAALLFPAPDAKDLCELGPGLRTLVILDGTWPLARKLMRLNPFLERLPKVTFRPSRPGNYRIRREPAEHCLATIEAVAEVLGLLEGDAPRFRQMLRAFEAMVDGQIARASARTGPSRYRVRPGEWIPNEERVRRALAACLPKAVLVHAEGNARRGEAVSGPHQLLHLVAFRPRSAERFEALIRPAFTLSPTTPSHLELEAAAFDAGMRLDEALAGFSRFVGAEETLCHWGSYSLQLLRSAWPTVRPKLDLRDQAARFVGRRPGSLEEVARRLGVPVPTPLGMGRAGRRLGAMAQIASRLVSGALP